MYEFVDALRREAIQKLRAGKVEEAIHHSSSVPRRYVGLLEYSGINMSQLFVLQPLMAAIKVLAAAMLQTGRADNKMLADVEETEAILEGCPGRNAVGTWGATARSGGCCCGSRGSRGRRGGGEEEQGSEAEAAEAQGSAAEEGS